MNGIIKIDKILERSSGIDLKTQNINDLPALKISISPISPHKNITLEANYCEYQGSEKYSKESFASIKFKEKIKTELVDILKKFYLKFLEKSKGKDYEDILKELENIENELQNYQSPRDAEPQSLNLLTQTQNQLRRTRNLLVLTQNQLVLTQNQLTLTLNQNNNNMYIPLVARGQRKRKRGEGEECDNERTDVKRRRTESQNIINDFVYCALLNKGVLVKKDQEGNIEEFEITDWVEYISFSWKRCRNQYQELGNPFFRLSHRLNSLRRWFIMDKNTLTNIKIGRGVLTLRLEKKSQINTIAKEMQSIINDRKECF